MPKADSVHSTPPTNSPISHSHQADATSRRRFLTAAASIAASGTVLALAAPPTSATAAITDPIFALIEAHRSAAVAHSAACAEQTRREQVLIDEGIGLCPFVATVSVGRPIIAHSHKQIADYADSLSEKAVAEAHTSLTPR
jgi:hypothetical protein